MGVTDSSWALRYLIIIMIFAGCMGMCVGLFLPSNIENSNKVYIGGDNINGTVGNQSFRALTFWDMATPGFIFDLVTYQFLPFELRIAFNIVNIVVIMATVYLTIAFVKGIFPFNLIMGGA